MENISEFPIRSFSVFYQLSHEFPTSLLKPALAFGVFGALLFGWHSRAAAAQADGQIWSRGEKVTALESRWTVAQCEQPRTWSADRKPWLG